jgi:hypothetical protein
MSPVVATNKTPGEQDAQAVIAESSTSWAPINPENSKSPIRGLFIELLADLLVLILCTLVCLQIIAVAQVRLENSGALSFLGLTSVDIVEYFHTGSDLAGIQKEFGGQLNDDSLVISFDRKYQPTDDPELVWYQISFRMQAEESGYTAADLQLVQGDLVLIEWSIGRYQVERQGLE